jgi:hypothetical protein
MLFGVTYVNEEIDKVHKALDYLFTQLPINTNTEFSDDLFPPDFKPLLYKYGNTTKGYRNYVTNILKPIFNLYKSTSFTASQKKMLCDTFFSSNKIEEICNDSNLIPIDYNNLDTSTQGIAPLFLSLYDNLGAIIDKDAHFENFKTINGKICSVCGLDTIYQYDHFFPKGTATPIYPFSSVNPKNLIPICQGCNGKKSSNLIFYSSSDENKERVVTFFPYSGFETWEHLAFKLTKVTNPSAGNFGVWKVTISIKTTEIAEDYKNKIERWKKFFDIESRYSKELRTNINIWIQLFKEKNITLDEMIKELVPTMTNIKRTNSVILEWLFFDYLKTDEVLKQTLISSTISSTNPNDLLNLQ